MDLWLYGKDYRLSRLCRVSVVAAVTLARLKTAAKAGSKQTIRYRMLTVTGCIRVL
jgi:hypothetical protein